MDAIIKPTSEGVRNEVCARCEPPHCTLLLVWAPLLLVKTSRLLLRVEYSPSLWGAVAASARERSRSGKGGRDLRGAYSISNGRGGMGQVIA